MLVDDQAATFIVRAAGHSMTGAGISDGDELLVDRSKHAQHGDIIVAVMDGELTVKRLELTAAGVVLRAESAGHPDIVVPETRAHSRRKRSFTAGAVWRQPSTCSRPTSSHDFRR